MRAFYSDSFVLPLPPGHRFPMEKYARLRSRVLSELPPGAVQLELAPAASDVDILRVHAPAWLQAVSAGTLSAQQQREIGFPWSLQMAERSRRSAGATIGACLAAIEDGTGVNLAGGTHHAFHDRGAGYCVFNDAAIAAAAMQAAAEIASKPPVAVWGTKHALHYARDHSVDDALKQMGWLQSGIWSNAHVQQAISAFQQKKSAVFPDLAPLKSFKDLA
jgi:enoyl-CoA hydratase/carnithine racemase